jgi:hypothetical protein
MVISDYVAIGIVLFFVILGLLGSLRWITQVLYGLFIGLVVLCGIVYMTGNPTVNTVSKGLFEKGKIFPYLKNQMESVQEYISKIELISKVDTRSQSSAQSKYVFSASNDKNKQP